MRHVLFAAAAVLIGGVAIAQTANPPVPAGANPGPVIDPQRALPADVGRAGLDDASRAAAARRPNGVVAPPSAISSGVQVIAPEKK